MHVRNGVVAALVAVQAFGMAGCEKSQEPVTTVTEVCGKFSFSVANRIEADKARVAFYAASVRFGGFDFSDDSRFRNVSRFMLGGQMFTLDELNEHQPLNDQARSGETSLTLQVRAINTVKNTRSVKSIPCTGPGSAKAFDNVKAAFSESRKIRVEIESPAYARQRAKK